MNFLVCEDDETSLDLVCELISLTWPKSAVFAARDGGTGLALFREHLPEVVITDVQMPVLDGVKMCREIETIKPDVKTILMSAYRKQTMEDLTVKLTSIRFYFFKPLVYQELVGAISHCLVNEPEGPVAMPAP